MEHEGGLREAMGGGSRMAPVGRREDWGSGGEDGEGGGPAATREAVMMSKDTLLLVLAFLPPRDILRCAAVCSAWSQAIGSAPPSLWRSSLLNLPGHPQAWSTASSEGRLGASAAGHLQRTPDSTVTGDRCWLKGDEAKCSPLRSNALEAECSPLRSSALEAEAECSPLRSNALEAEALARWSHGTPVVSSVEAHVGRATCVKHAAGVVVSGGVDEMVCVWAVSETSSQRRRLRRLLHLRSPLGRPIADVDATDALLLAASGSQVLVWSRVEPSAGRLRKSLGEHHQAVEKLAHADTVVAAACSDGTLHVFDLYSGSTQQILRPHRRAVTCVSLDGSATLLLSGGGDGAAVLHDLRASQAVCTLLPPWKASGWVAAVHLLGPGQGAGGPSPMGTALVGTSRGDVFRWDLRQGQVQGSGPAAERRVCDREQGGALLAGLTVMPWDPLPCPLLALSASTQGELQVLELASLQPMRHLSARAWQTPPSGRLRGSERVQGSGGGTGRSPWQDLKNSTSATMLQPQGSQGSMANAMRRPQLASASGKGITGISASWGGLALSQNDGTLSLLEFHM